MRSHFLFFFKICLPFYCILVYLLIYFLVTLHSTCDLTCSPCFGSMESYPPDYQGNVSASLKSGHIKCWWLWECKDTITMKQLTGFLYSSTYSTYCMTIPLLGIYLREMKADAYTNAALFIIPQNCQQSRCSSKRMNKSMVI